MNSYLDSFLRKAILSDIEEIINLIKTCFDIKLDNYFIECLNFSIRNNYSYVYIMDNKIVGYVDIYSINTLNLFGICMEDYEVSKTLKSYLGSKINNCYEITNLCVHPNYRGYDLGFKLVSGILKDFSDSNFLVFGIHQTKIGKWLAEKIFIRLGFLKLLEKENFWYNHSLKYNYNCNLCLKEPEDTVCCRCTGSVWLL